MKYLGAIAAVCGVLVIAGCGGGDEPSGNAATAAGSTAATGLAGPVGIEPVDVLTGQEPRVPVPKGHPPTKITRKTLKQGTGREAETGDLVTIQFNAIFFNGRHFESSWEFGKAFRFKLGADKVSPGWEKGIPGMREGGRYELAVPWTLISSSGIPSGTDPTDAEIYVLDLLEVSDAA